MLQRKNVAFTNPRNGQLIVGPPGSGKTTYCKKSHDFYKDLGRSVGIVNLDPANENVDYSAVVDVMNLITVADVMQDLNLGPNGALVYAIEFLENHLDDWLLPALKKTLAEYNYILFDCPGQVELYTHNKSMANIFKCIEEKIGVHLVTVNLIDSHYCSDPTKFIATLLLALNMMLNLGLPHVNVLSKADLLRKHESKLLFDINFYTEVLDLKYLLDALDDTPMTRSYKKLNAAICSMVEDFSLVSFHLLEVDNTQSLLRLRNVIDKVSGYVYRAGEEKTVNTLMACAVGVESETDKYAKDIEPYI